MTEDLTGLLRFYTTRLRDSGWTEAPELGLAWVKREGSTVRVATWSPLGAEMTTVAVCVWGGEMPAAEFPATPGPPNVFAPVPRPPTGIARDNAEQVAELARWQTGMLTWSPDGKLAAAPMGGYTLLVDIASGRVEQVLRQLWVGFLETHVAFGPDGRSLAVADSVESWVWDVASGQRLHALQLADDCDAGKVAFAQDGQTLAAACSYTDTVGFYTADSGVPVGSIESSAETMVLDFFFLPGQPGMLTSGRSGAEIWSVPSGHKLQALASLPEAYHGVAVSPDGQVLARGDKGSLGLWDIPSGKVVRTISLPDTSDSTGLAFSPDGSLLAYTTTQRQLMLIDAASGRVLVTLTGYLGAPAFSPDGHLLAVRAEPGVAFLGVK